MNQNSQPSQSGDKKNVNAIVSQSVAFFGPLPPPQVLEQYEKVLPGAADRIITMAEQQSVHRRQLETKVIDSDVKNSKLGLCFGLIIGIAALISATVMAFFNITVGGGLALFYVASLVGIFIYGSQGKKVAIQEKKKESKE